MHKDVAHDLTFEEKMNVKYDIKFLEYKEFAEEQQIYKEDFKKMCMKYNFSCFYISNEDIHIFEEKYKPNCGNTING